MNSMVGGLGCGWLSMDGSAMGDGLVAAIAGGCVGCGCLDCVFVLFFVFFFFFKIKDRLWILFWLWCSNGVGLILGVYVVF